MHLTDPPFLVVTLADIEIASLERVQYGLRQFDLVLIFKDFTKPPLHINSIPSAQMDDVKNWLEYVLSFNFLEVSSDCSSSVDIPMSDGPVNLNWGPIMKHINESPYDFFQNGGWSFLGGGGAAEVRVIFDAIISSLTYLFRVIILKNLIQSQILRRAAKLLCLQRIRMRRVPMATPMSVAVALITAGRRAMVSVLTQINNLNLTYFLGEDWDELERKAAKGSH